MDVDFFQNILGATMILFLACYAITTGIMYVAAKIRGYTPVGVHVKNKWDINLNIKFFSDMRKNYVALGKPRIVPIINFISFYGLFIGFVLIILSEFFRY